MRRIYKNTRYGLLFFERKVSPRTLHQIRPLYFCKAFEVPRNFSRKVSCVRGLGQMPQLIMHTKKRGLHRVFYIVIMCWNCVPNLLLLLFFRRKVSKRTSHRLHHFIFAKAFEFPKDFSRKVLWSGSHGGQPQLIMHTKSTALPCFFIYVSFAFKYRLYLPFLVSRFHRIFQFTEIANKRVRLFFGIVLIERYKIYILF